jgi:hypothetical protein
VRKGEVSLRGRSRDGIAATRARSSDGAARRASILSPMHRRARVGAAVALACAAAPAKAAAPVPTPIGVGPRFHPPPAPASVLAGRPAGRFRCVGTRRMERAHLEVFARRRAVIMPAGIGVSRARSCSYPIRTITPTGVVEFDASLRLTVGDVFDIWGQRLARGQLDAFAGHVHAFVAGRSWPGAVRAIRLRRHAQIVLEVGAYVPPHPRFLFGPGR